MRTLLPLAARSLWSRRVTAALCVFAIATSVALLLGVQTLRTGARESFASTISGTDLIVGARSGPLNLLLYSVFHIGDATTAVSWDSFELVRRHPDVAWALPVSLGDSHRGFRVMGTSADYFEHFRYGRRQSLAFAAGGPFADVHDAVLGAGAATALGYALDAPLEIAHGLGETSFARHDDHPFRVTGILAPTGTPVDRLVIVGVDAIAAIHEGWRGGARTATGPLRTPAPPPDGAVGGLTAFLVGMKSKTAVLQMQRALNEYRGEPLTAVMPGVALGQLWRLVGVADTALLAVAGCVVLAGFAGMVAVLLTSLEERRREMAILRSVGARPVHVFALLVLESSCLAAAGAALGCLVAWLSVAAGAPLLAQRFGLFVEVGAPGAYDLAVAVAVVGAGAVAGLVPAWRAYRNSLADGLSIGL